MQAVKVNNPNNAAAAAAAQAAAQDARNHDTIGLGFYTEMPTGEITIKEFEGETYFIFLDFILCSCSS